MNLEQLKQIQNPKLTIPGLYDIELYPFQKLGVMAIHNTPRLILGDSVGLGKTVQSTSAIQLLHNLDELTTKDVLVVCPKAVRPDWSKTIKNHTALTPLIGDESDKNCQYLKRRWNVLILGFPTVRVRIEQLLKNPFKMIIVDEGLFKNADSKTFSALKQLTDKAHRVLILNATSMEISLAEVYSHIEIIQPGLISFEDFKTRFCKVEKKYFRTVYRTLKFTEKITGFKDLGAAEDLKNFISPFYIKRSYDDVSVQLPEKVIKNIRVELLPAQKREYTLQISKYKDKQIKGSALCYNLLRICDGKLDNFEKEELPTKVSAKAQAFESLLDSIGNKPIVVYSTYIAPLLAFARVVKASGRKVGFFTGKNEDTRDAHLEEFKRGERDVLMLTKAGQRGINLENSAHLILINQLFNGSAATQLHGRISRITSKFDHIFVYNLLTVDTIEEEVLNLLEQRGTVSEFINEEGSISELNENQVALLLKSRKSLINKESLDHSLEQLEELA